MIVFSSNSRAWFALLPILFSANIMFLRMRDSAPTLVIRPPSEVEAVKCDISIQFDWLALMIKPMYLTEFTWLSELLN